MPRLSRIVNRPLKTFLVTYEGRNGLLSKDYVLSTSKARATAEAKLTRKSSHVVNVQQCEPVHDNLLQRYPAR